MVDDVKPKAEPEIKTEEVKVDDKEVKEPAVKTPQSAPTISVEDFKNVQKQLLEAQTQLEVIAKEKESAQKVSMLEQIKAVNPKLAEINKDASLETLKVVFTTAESITTGFKKHIKDGEPIVDPKSILNVGDFDALKDQWNI